MQFVEIFFNLFCFKGRERPDFFYHYLFLFSGLKPLSYGATEIHNPVVYVHSPAVYGWDQNDAKERFQGIYAHSKVLIFVMI